MSSNKQSEFSILAQMKFSFYSLRLILIVVIIAINNSSCRNLFSKNIVPETGCIECLGKKGLSDTEESEVRKTILADEKAKRLDSLFTYRAKRLGFNGNVMVIQKGVTLYEHSFGYENYRNKTPLSAESKFQLASLSKTFTAVAILKLMEDGLLTLQNTVTDYFPNFPFKEVTIEMLLTHRSGIPDYRFAYANLNQLQFKQLTNQGLMEHFAKSPPKLNAKPGRKFSYCNSNYAILAAIIEKISDMPFDEYMHKYVFEPIGMNHTYLITSADDSLHINQTLGYGSNWSGQRIDAFDGITGDKGIYSTTGDLAKWYKMLTSDCYLKKETLDMAFQPRSFEQEGERNYGYGFRMNNCNSDLKCVYHNGWWHGYNTLFYMHPKSQSVVIVLGNRLNHSVYKVQDVLNILQAGVCKDIPDNESGE